MQCLSLTTGNAATLRCNLLHITEVLFISWLASDGSYCTAFIGWFLPSMTPAPPVLVSYYSTWHLFLCILCITWFGSKMFLHLSPELCCWLLSADITLPTVKRYNCMFFSFSLNPALLLGLVRKLNLFCLMKVENNHLRSTWTCII